MAKSRLVYKKKLDLKKRKIRAFFSSIETKRKKKEEIDSEVEEIYQDGMVYIQMKLPVEKITEQFTDTIKEKIEHSIIKAQIREATKADLDSLKNIYNRAWLTSNTPYRPITKTDLQKILEYPETVFLIAKVYGTDAAFVLLDFEGKDKEIAIIAALGVIPRFQRKGLGSVLGTASWQYLKERYPNLKEIRCEVYKDNFVSYSFIKQIGFEEYGRKVYRKQDFELSES
ncbi:MAG: GNAT family N-acetyltransferase [Candidatus Odinarchaeota archaeon]